MRSETRRKAAPDLNGEAKDRDERAKGLREEAERLAAGKPPRRPPRSPHEFVEERMKEKAKEDDRSEKEDRSEES